MNNERVNGVRLDMNLAIDCLSFADDLAIFYVPWVAEKQINQLDTQEAKVGLQIFFEKLGF